MLNIHSLSLSKPKSKENPHRIFPIQSIYIFRCIYAVILRAVSSLVTHFRLLGKRTVYRGSPNSGIISAPSSGKYSGRSFNSILITLIYSIISLYLYFQGVQFRLRSGFKRGNSACGRGLKGAKPLWVRFYQKLGRFSATSSKYRLFIRIFLSPPGGFVTHFRLCILLHNMVSELGCKLGTGAWAGFTGIPIVLYPRLLAKPGLYPKPHTRSLTIYCLIQVCSRVPMHTRPRTVTPVP